jgi:predicted metal-dependent hydrolase
MADYDPLYLAGILFFNEGDFFEAHEVWEDAWMNSTGDLKKFYQGLIQAAVGLLHFCNGNLSGARKLYHSSRDKMRDLPSPYLGFDIPGFWRDMECCFRELLAHDGSQPAPQPQDDLLPTIQITPPPEHWPNPRELLKEE